MSMPDLEIMGYEPEVINEKRGQVYMATHKGENYLPFMNRSFISFSYGGKNIEDFNLIATVSGDRMDRQVMAEFDNLTTTYEVLNGQFYWGTYYKNNALNFNLSTDGITQELLDDFLHWFLGGKIRELILAEHPNRAIMARIQEAPEIALLPFEHPSSIKIAGKTYTTSTTLYKGDIKLNMVMDEPFWYSKVNIFGFKDDLGVYHDEWEDANGNLINILDPMVNKDAIKIIAEDGIPVSSMLSSSMILGDNIYANLDGGYTGMIARDTIYVAFTRDIVENAPVITVYLGVGDYVLNELLVFYVPDDQLPIEVVEPYFSSINKAIIAVNPSNNILNNLEVTKEILYNALNATLSTVSQESYSYADMDTRNECIIADVVDGEVRSGALISGPYMSENTGIPELAPEGTGYFYYCGTAPSPVELIFTLTPMTSDYYISVPRNSYVHELDKPAYNILTIESVHKSELYFTTPGLYTSYNKAMLIFKAILAGLDWVAVREAIRGDIHHPAVRAWANKVVDCLDIELAGVIGEGDSSDGQEYMRFMIRAKSVEEEYLPGIYVFNSKTGKATARIQYRMPTTETPTSYNDWINYGTIMNEGNNVKEEEVGDMLRSNYLMIEDRNYPNKENGDINQWSPDHPDASHKVYNDVANGLKNVIIKYKNLYF